MDESRQQLLDNNASLKRTSDRIDSAYKIALDTQDVGQDILFNLGEQRKTIERSRARLYETDASLSKSNRVLNKIMNASRRQKLIGGFIIFMCICISIIIIILKLS